MTTQKKKVNFILIDDEGSCDFHPNSKVLGIEDGEVLTKWCLECLYKMLKQDKGLWDVGKKES